MEIHFGKDEDRVCVIGVCGLLQYLDSLRKRLAHSTLRCLRCQETCLWWRVHEQKHECLLCIVHGMAEDALRLAEAFAGSVAPPGGRPFTVKVLGMSLDELLAFQGTTRAEFAAGIETPDAELRQLAERTCIDVLRRSDEPAVRGDAMDILTELGVLRS